MGVPLQLLLLWMALEEAQPRNQASSIGTNEVLPALVPPSVGSPSISTIFPNENILVQGYYLLMTPEVRTWI